jgi:hypothetical protein
MVTLILTDEQADKLSETLWEAQDMGPATEGWKSDELTELCDLVDRAIGGKL